MLVVVLVEHVLVVRIVLAGIIKEKEANEVSSDARFLADNNPP